MCGCGESCCGRSAEGFRSLAKFFRIFLLAMSIWSAAVRQWDDGLVTGDFASLQDAPLNEEFMKYVCLGYIDESKFAAIPPEVAQKMMDECFAYDDELRRGGHFIGGEALDTARNAVTLRTRDGEVVVTDGPFAETKETLGGILFLEARDLNHAIALMSKHPGVKMGPFEIRPADETINELCAKRSAEIAKGN